MTDPRNDPDDTSATARYDTDPAAPTPTPEAPSPPPDAPSPPPETPSATTDQPVAPPPAAAPQDSAPPPPPMWRRRDNDPGRWGTIVFGGILVAVGLWFFADQTLGLDMPRLRWSELWPIFIIVLGGWIVLGSMRRDS